MCSLSMMVWIPPRGNFEACYISAAHIISIYTSSKSLFIELPRTTLAINYESAQECQQACLQFVDACINTPSLEERARYPIPSGGQIHSFK